MLEIDDLRSGYFDETACCIEAGLVANDLSALVANGKAIAEMREIVRRRKTCQQGESQGELDRASHQSGYCRMYGKGKLMPKVPGRSRNRGTACFRCSDRFVFAPR